MGGVGKWLWNLITGNEPRNELEHREPVSMSALIILVLMIAFLMIAAMDAVGRFL